MKVIPGSPHPVHNQPTPLPKQVLQLIRITWRDQVFLHAMRHGALKLPLTSRMDADQSMAR